jgi:Rrf2 family protein
MKFSAKTRYGTRALLDLAMHQESNSPVPLKEIAGRQDISLTYLEHIIAPMIAAGLINSVRGTRGGISLAKIARDITLKEVVQVLEGPSSPVECVITPQSCSRSSTCAARDIWGEVMNAIDSVLTSTSLQDLADRQTLKSSASEMYFI